MAVKKWHHTVNSRLNLAVPENRATKNSNDWRLCLAEWSFENNRKEWEKLRLILRLSFSGKMVLGKFYKLLIG